MIDDRSTACLLDNVKCTVISCVLIMDVNALTIQGRGKEGETRVATSQTTFITRCLHR